MDNDDLVNSNNQLQLTHAGHEAEFLFFTTPDGKMNVEVWYAGETIWLSQKRMGEFFGVESNTITYHLKEIFKSGELEEDSVTRIFRATASDGKSYNTKFYNLDAIISVGYRVNSIQATAFRHWATEVLREYMIKGFAMDDERLKNGTHFGKDYFKELLERIREIRISERRLYLQMMDIFALASDYDTKSELTREFFAFIQNKLHYAIAGKTAVEIVYGRADKDEHSMGLTNWKLAAEGKILRTDVTVAKNYLNEQELRRLRLAVTAFLDIAQSRAERQIPTDMSGWLGIMDGYLDLNEYPKLQGAGRISKDKAHQKALNEHEVFRIRQDKEFIGDFERAAAKLIKIYGQTTHLIKITIQTPQMYSRKIRGC